MGQNLSVRPIPLWHITSNLWARTCQWGQYLYDISQVTCDPEFVMDRPGHDRMVVGVTTTYGISAIRGGVLDAALCDEVSQWLVTCLWYSPGTSFSSTNKTDCRDITELLLKVALSAIILTQNLSVKHIPLWQITFFFIIYTYYTCIPRGNIKLSPLARLDKGHNKIPSLSL